MKFNELRIQGFRSYGEVGQIFDLHNRLTVLSAPNSQGKSSTLEALEFLLTGVLERREQFASAKAEFEGSIRNVHVSDDTETFVEAEIVTDEATTHKIRRVLVSDYGAKRSCQTQLYIDGNKADELSEIGLGFESGPLHLPILRQHTLRHTVSGPPSERAEFLKSLLEVTDLDTVHTAIREALRELHDAERDYVGMALELGELTSPVQDLGERLVGLSKMPEDEVRAVLQDGMERSITDLATQEVVEVEEGYAPCTEQLRDLIQSRRDAVYPVGHLRGGEVTEVFELEVPNDKSKGYNAAVAAIDHTLRTYREVYSALLKLEQVDEEEAPLDCPICQTDKALTKGRIAEMREKLEESDDYQEAKSVLLEKFELLDDLIDELDGSTSRAIPPAASWKDDEQTQYRASAFDVAEEMNEEEYSNIEKHLASLATKRAKVRDTLSEAAKTIDALREQVENNEKVGLSLLHERVAQAGKAWGSLRAALGKYDEAVGPVEEILETAVRDEAGLRPFEIVADLAESPAELRDELVELRATEVICNAVEGALMDISGARVKVLDRRFAQLSGDVAKWWDYIRPGDPASFRSVQRRGTGLRFVDFKASLTGPDDDPDDGRSGKVRDAAAVFSDSQLNALGVSTFLAKWTRDSVGFLVLDDPVLASDRAHISTFSRNVVDELLDSTDLQVIIATYSDDFSQRLQDLYQHVSPGVYFLSISNPKSGTEAKAVSDSLDSYLERAEAYLGNQDPDMRRECATNIRRAAERFCKELIVKYRRADGENCSIVEYRGESLRILEPEARKYLSEPDHPGRLKAIRRVVNPGPHDDTPPTVASLRTSKGDLEYFRRDYL